MDTCKCKSLANTRDKASFYGDLLICDICAQPRESKSSSESSDDSRVWELEGEDWEPRVVVDGERYESPSQKVVLIEPHMISGRAEIAGYSIKENLGIATELTSASGWTASAKGNSALNRAFYGFVRNSSRMGGNAIVSVSISTFGAAGGITSMVGGDAVGVLITGTVVIVEKN